MGKTNKLLQNPEKITSKPWRDAWMCTLSRLVLVFIWTGLCSMMLTGCEGFWDTTADLLRLDGNDAEAQGDTSRTRIETFAVNTDGFQIVLDSDSDPTPSHTMVDGGTEFTIGSDNATMMTGNGRSIGVDLNDVIILRLNGESGSATLIRSN